MCMPSARRVDGVVGFGSSLIVADLRGCTICRRARVGEYTFPRVYSDIPYDAQSGLYRLYSGTVARAGKVVSAIAGRVARAKDRGVDLSRKRFARSNHFFFVSPAMKRRAVVTRVTDLLRAREGREEGEGEGTRCSYWRIQTVRILHAAPYMCICVYIHIIIYNGEHILQFIPIWNLR